MTQQLVRWEPGYYNDGKWVTSDKKEVNLKGNFFATYEGKRIIVVMSTDRTMPGHGEPSFEYSVPNYLDAQTLEDLSLSRVYIGVDENAKLPPVAKKYFLFIDLAYFNGALAVAGEFATLQELLDHVLQAPERDKWDWLYIVNVETRQAVVLISSHTPFADLSLATPGLADL